MSVITRSALARAGVRIGGIVAGLVLGVIIAVISAVISSALGSMSGTWVQGPPVSPIVFSLLGWAAAEAVIWLAVRRADALPRGSRPEMPDELPLVEPVSETRTRYPVDASRLPHLPPRTPDPETQSSVRRLVSALREEFSVEVAYQRVDAERRPAAETYFAHEKALLAIARVAERNAAISLTLVLGLFLPAALFSGIMLGLAVIVSVAATWLVTKAVRRALLPRLRRPGAREVEGMSPSFTTIVPFSAHGTVGGNLSGAAAEFGQGLVDMGTAGEIRTARLLDSSLAGITRVAVFHSLRFPGLDRADVDHVVLVDTNHGPSLIVVDSKAWKPGVWSQISGESVQHSPSGEIRESIMPLAVQKFAQAGFSARAMTVIHASSKSVAVHRAEGAAHSYVDSERLIDSILTQRNTAPPLRGESDPALALFLRQRDDLARRLVS